MLGRTIKQSTITIASAVVAVIIGALLAGGVVFSSTASDQLQEARERQLLLSQLGRDVAASSALLTDEVRNFAMTGDTRHLDAYWHEVDVEQSQAAALEELRELGVAEEHLALVAEASANSATLVETETRAMRLALEAQGVAESSMPAAIASYELPSELAGLEDAAKLEIAREILFDSGYQAEVARIMEPLDRFAEVLTEEADAAVSAAGARSDRAALLLLVLTVLVPLAIGGLLWVVHRSTGRPIGRYVRTLGALHSDTDQRLEPEGTVELQALATALNDQLDRSDDLLTTISDAAARTSEEAGSVSAAAEQVSSNVTTVATAIEEMTASVSEIAKSAGEASTVASQAVQQATETNTTVSRLGESSSEIGAVIETITSIAEQTNLLALNATIEAARAGEAGKGFAVVAGEVKDLAQQTAHATEDIAARIRAIQSDTDSAVSEIARIAETIGRISEHQQTISSAVDEQTATTSEISRNITEAATGVSDVSAGIARVAQVASAGLGTDAASETTTGAHEVDGADGAAGRSTTAPDSLSAPLPAGVGAGW